MRNALLVILLCLTPTLAAQQMDLPPDIREWYRNVNDERGHGSCVQASLGMAGVWVNCPQASTLLWDTQYGPAERGGAWPERVSRYAQARKIPLYNVTGQPSIHWAAWAARTGRGCGVALGLAHFQTVYGFDARTRTFAVCDNNTPRQIDYYTYEEFTRLHRRSGLWCVILNSTPGTDAPKYLRWWQQ